MENADLIEQTEESLERVVMVAHKSGLNYWEILKLLPDLTGKLIMMADVEYWLNQKKG